MQEISIWFLILRCSRVKLLGETGLLGRCCAVDFEIVYGQIWAVSSTGRRVVSTALAAAGNGRASVRPWTSPTGTRASPTRPRTRRASSCSSWTAWPVCGPTIRAATPPTSSVRKSDDLERIPNSTRSSLTLETGKDFVEEALELNVTWLAFIETSFCVETPFFGGGGETDVWPSGLRVVFKWNPISLKNIWCWLC